MYIFLVVFVKFPNAITESQHGRGWPVTWLRLAVLSPSTDPWGTQLATSLQLDLSTEHSPLSSATQPIFNASHCPLT